jgi:hypothetical protein
VRERCRLDLELVEYARRIYVAKRAALDMIAAGDPEILPPTIAQLADEMRSAGPVSLASSRPS